MMTRDEFAEYQGRLSLTDEGRSYLESAFKDGKPIKPCRQVKSRVGNVISRYPSSKVKKTFSLESRRAELAIALLLENDPEVLGYVTQPPRILLHYLGRTGRNLSIAAALDFLILRRDRIELVEAKTADDMPRLLKDSPGRYAQIDSLHWSCPPAEIAAKKLGFGFRVWTDADFTRERIRNLRHLDAFLKLGDDHYSDDSWKPVQDFLLKRPGTSLQELADASGPEGAKLVRWMLAHRLLFCDLDRFILAEPDMARVYPSASVAHAMEALKVAEPTWSSIRGPLSSESSVPAALSDLTKALLVHGKEAFDEAHKKWLIVTGRVPREQWDVTPHTVRIWRAAVQEKGYLGLIRNSQNTQGNHEPRITAEVDALAAEVINEVFLKPPQKTIMFAYRIFKSKCAELQAKNSDVLIPSHTWFYGLINALDKKKVVEAQMGKRAAYEFAFDEKCLMGLWDSRGDYPFMDVHCDHTQLPIFCVSTQTGVVLDKPWWTVLFDSTCRAVLASYLSFDRPSRDSLMMILRDCLLRHGRLPFGMIVDNGSEFRSTYFETFTASRGMLVVRRPAAEARYGNPIENYFGVSQKEFIQGLQGSSLIFRTPRKSTKSVDPRRLAVWTLPELAAVLDAYCFNYFNKRDHNDLGRSPDAALKDMCIKFGIDKMPRTEFNEDFLIQTMPEVPDGTVRVQKRCLIQFMGDKFYSAQLASHLGDDLPARWDPNDPSRILVKLPDGWVECYSKLRKEIEGLSVRDVAFFAKEHRARNVSTAQSRRKSDTLLGDFLRQATEKTEKELTRRRDLARENATVNSKLMGKKSRPDTNHETNDAPKASARVKQPLPHVPLMPRTKSPSLL